MKSFALVPAEERALYWRNYSNRTGVPEFIVEKDFQLGINIPLIVACEW